MEADSKQELKQYMEFAKQQARERDEKYACCINIEMLSYMRG